MLNGKNSNHLAAEYQYSFINLEIQNAGQEKV